MNRRQARSERALSRLTRLANVTLSEHASSRAKELGFSHDDVLRCVIRAEQTYCSPPWYGAGRRVYQRGTVAVVVQEESRVVVTVLLRTKHEWSHGVDSRHSIAPVRIQHEGEPQLG